MVVLVVGAAVVVVVVGVVVVVVVEVVVVVVVEVIVVVVVAGISSQSGSFSVFSLEQSTLWCFWL